MARARKPKTYPPVPYPPGWEPFLAAISANLDDDAPRLVFADWLQENGDEDRAEFIRIQCELERARRDVRQAHPLCSNREIQEVHFSQGQRAAAERENRLRVANFNRWIGPLPGWSKPTTWDFQRGFNHWFSPTARQWIEDGEHVRRQMPVESLIIQNTTGRGAALFALPSVAGLKRLSLPDLDTEAARILADSPALDCLQGLTLSKIGRWNLQAQATAAVISSPRLANLRSLWVNSNWAGDFVAEALVESPHTQELEELGLICAALGSKAFARLLASPKLKRLRRLNLQGNGLGDDAVRALVGSNLTGVVELNLRYNALTAASARMLAEWPGLASARGLELAGAQFGPEGIRQLLASEYLININTLELPRWEVRKRDQNELAALPACQRIRKVSFAS